MKPTITVKRVTDWNRVLNAARMTVHKARIEKEPTDAFKKSILMAEHSPIRLLEYDIIVEGIPYYSAMHLVRHFVGVEKFVTTSREDRTGVKREDRKQTDLVDLQLSVNAQSLINVSRKRLCSCADAVTRGIMRDVVEALRAVDPLVAARCVPECIYRGFCPEVDKCCGYCRTKDFEEKLKEYREL